MDVILAPDVYVNASVALKSPPEQVVQRLLGPTTKGKPPITPWILDRVAAMLSAIPEFKKEAVDNQVALIKDLVEVFETDDEHGPDQWREAMMAAAKKAGAKRIITDHPDLIDLEEEGLEFISTEAWLVEQTTPPPPPGT